jgi:hypothetical protein
MKTSIRYWITALLLSLAQGPAMADMDVLVVYTPAALTKADTNDILRVGVDAINAKIDFMIAEANLIFANSQLDQRLRLVGRQMVGDYVETGAAADAVDNAVAALVDPVVFAYVLEVVSVATTDELPVAGSSKLVLARVNGSELHIRIFDAVGEIVVDKGESELVGGDAVTELKNLFNEDMTGYTEEDKQDIIEKAASIAGHIVPDIWLDLDGQMDAVHQWRNEVGADLVSLIVDVPSGDVGQGFTPLQPNQFRDYKGFSVINIGSTALQLLPANVGMVFTHEIGHNLGCHHSFGEVGTNNRNLAVRACAFGHKFFAPWLVVYGTIMSNPEPTRVLEVPDALSISIKYFSNPDVSFLLVPTGTAEEDNARVIRETALWVEGYRDTVIPYGSIWVDTAYVGFEAGTFSQPYNSVQEGIDNVAPGGTIVFKEGSDDWTGTIDKAMTLTSGIGVMVIGR